MKRDLKDIFADKSLLLQDIGMLIFLICLFVSTMIVALSPEPLLTQNMLMLIFLFTTVVLAVFRLHYAAVILTAFQILAFASYKLYLYISEHDNIEVTAYIWVIVLLGMLAGITLFMHEFSAVEMTNDVLHKQVEEFTVVEPLTGLENLRSMYSNLARTMSLSKRNKTSMGLMIVKLRYTNELHSILTHNGFELLRQRLAEIVQDTLRLEDRIFSIDKYGSVGIIYFCNEDGAATIKRRLLNVISQKDAFDGITDKPIRVEVRIAYLGYDPAFGTDAMRFCRKVESELQYDV